MSEEFTELPLGAIWDGAAWQLEYTPYTYPHPLRAGDPAPDPGGGSSLDVSGTATIGS